MLLKAYYSAHATGQNISVNCTLEQAKLVCQQHHDQKRMVSGKEAEPLVWSGEQGAPPQRLTAQGQRTTYTLRLQ